MTYYFSYWVEPVIEKEKGAGADEQLHKPLRLSRISGL
jgi:hypothetical protein